MITKTFIKLKKVYQSQVMYWNVVHREIGTTVIGYKFLWKQPVL